MAGVALRRFQVTVIQLQLVSRAAVSEGMKNNIGKVGFFLEPSEGVIDDGFLTRTAIRQSNDKAIVQMILSILVDTFISKISLPMQPVPEIRSISGA